MSVEDAVRQAIEANEEPAIDEIGGMNAVLAEADALATSRWFGDVVGMLAVAGLAVGAAGKLIADGLRRNTHRNALIHAVDALAACPPPDLREVVLALDERTRDRASSPLLRVEAATGVMRFAIVQPRWQSFATSSVQLLEDIDDPFAGPMVCRLAAVGWEHFRNNELLTLLERKSRQPDTAGQATLGALKKGKSSYPEAPEGARLVGRPLKGGFSLTSSAIFSATASKRGSLRHARRDGLMDDRPPSGASAEKVRALHKAGVSKKRDRQRGLTIRRTSWRAWSRSTSLRRADRLAHAQAVSEHHQDQEMIADAVPAFGRRTSHRWRRATRHRALPRHWHRRASLGSSYPNAGSRSRGKP